jgi:hypothetical protein
MPIESSNDGPLAFGEFVEYLRDQRFTVGVEEYLRLQELMNRIGDGVAPSDLKTLLCPLFATTKGQQRQFHDAFDAHFQLFQPASSDVPADEPSEVLPLPGSWAARSPRRTLYAALGVLILFAFGTVLWIIYHNRVPPPGPTPEVVSIKPTPEQFPPEPIFDPTPNQQNAPEPTLWKRYGGIVRYGALATPLILFLGYELYRFNRRRLVLQKQRGKRPPYAWPLEIELQAAQVYDSERFHNAARLMRRRQVDEFNRLDVEQTVAATIAARGYPTFRYRPYSKAPEYLVLVDRASFRDHQAQLFDHLIKALQKESIFLSRYFYDGDPRICFGDAGSEGIRLTELQMKYVGHRLLIFGDGERLIDPVSGELEPWVTFFSGWHERAVLTPEIRGQWGLKEIALASQFIVLPATLEGLLSLIDNFDSVVTADLRGWSPIGPAMPRRFEPSSAAGTLRAYLGEETFQWLCACAVYPDLQWDLTLHLALLPCMHKGLIKEENLFRLIRLPWFRTGTMPDELRWTLIRQLEPAREKSIRSALIQLLEKNPPQETMSQTFAADAYQLTLMVQQWLYLRSRKALCKALKFMKTLSPSQVYRDQTVIRYLESARSSPLHLLLPGRLRKLFYRDGVPAFGMKTSVRLIMTIAMIALAWWHQATQCGPANGRAAKSGGAVQAVPI